MASGGMVGVLCRSRTSATATGPSRPPRAEGTGPDRARRSGPAGSDQERMYPFGFSTYFLAAPWSKSA